MKTFGENIVKRTGGARGVANRFTAEQIDGLVHVFNQMKYPDPDTYDAIASKFGLTRTQTQKWFTNRRHRQRRQIQDAAFAVADATDSTRSHDANGNSASIDGGPDLPAEPEQPELKCLLCPENFNDAKAFQLHLASKHYQDYFHKYFHVTSESHGKCPRKGCNTAIKNFDEYIEHVGITHEKLYKVLVRDNKADLANSLFPHKSGRTTADAVLEMLSELEEKFGSADSTARADSVRVESPEVPLGGRFQFEEEVTLQSTPKSSSRCSTVDLVSPANVIDFRNTSSQSILHGTAPEYSPVLSGDHESSCGSTVTEYSHTSWAGSRCLTTTGNRAQVSNDITKIYFKCPGATSCYMYPKSLRVEFRANPETVFNQFRVVSKPEEIEVHHNPQFRSAVAYSNANRDFFLVHCPSDFFKRVIVAERGFFKKLVGCPQILAKLDEENDHIFAHNCIVLSTLGNFLDEMADPIFFQLENCVDEVASLIVKIELDLEVRCILQVNY